MCEMVTWSEFHAEDQQVLGSTIKKSSSHGDLVRGICAPLFYLLGIFVYVFIYICAEIINFCSLW